MLGVSVLGLGGLSVVAVVLDIVLSEIMSE